jgi:ribosomal RNA-processing protein 7
MSIFERFGTVEKVKLGEFASKKAGYPTRDTLHNPLHVPAGERHAHVVFASISACRSALACTDVLEFPASSAGGEHGEDFLAAVRAAHHSRSVSPGDLQSSVDAQLAAFDERTEAERRARREGRVDEDGFQLVTYKRKNRHVDPLSVEAPIKKRKELADFYRFQIREKKRFAPPPPRHLAIHTYK